MTECYEGQGVKESNYHHSSGLISSLQEYDSDDGHQDYLDQTASFSDEIVKNSMPAPKDAKLKFIPTKKNTFAEYPKKLANSWFQDETFLDKLDRLNIQVEELEQEFEKRDQQHLDLGGNDALDIAASIKNLSEKLKHLNDRALQSPLEKIPHSSENLILLQKDIEAFKSNRSIASTQHNTTPPEAAETKGKLIYQLMIDKKLASSSISDEKVYQLEQRITNLERVIGMHAIDPASSVSSNDSSLFTTSGTLIGALERVDHHLALLTDPAVFEKALRRIKESTASLERLAELKRKQKLESRSGLLGKGEIDSDTSTLLLFCKILYIHLDSTSSNEAKITYLYNQMLKLDAVSNIIPHLISRLSALQSLHAEAAQFGETMTVLREDQKMLAELGTDTKKGLDALVKTMLENQSKTSENIAALDARIKASLK